MGDYIAVATVRWVFDNEENSENILITNISTYSEAIVKIEELYGEDLVQIDNFTLLDGPFLKVSDKYLDKIMTGEIEE